MEYKDQCILLASKHNKEQAISEVFFNNLACTIDVEPFDTDQFGTFTGEIARDSSPYETCISKATAAADMYGYKLSLANEGSFGPHPSIPFVASDHEIMVFLDRKNGWVISEHLLTTETNYNHMIINKKSNINPFLVQVGFPTHGLTLQFNETKQVIAKGLNDISLLSDALDLGFKQGKELLLATDMRAMMNPTRMQAIKKLAIKLVDRIATNCPRCQTPGFGFKRTSGNLPCNLCAGPTSYYKNEVLGCIQCDYEQPMPRKDGMEVADPTYCTFCNP